MCCNMERQVGDQLDQQVEFIVKEDSSSNGNKAILGVCAETVGKASKNSCLELNNSVV